MDTIFETLLQTGAIGIIAYFLIQYQREQAQEHREELQALLTQTAQGQERQAREHREEMRALIESNNEALHYVAAMLEKAAGELDSLEAKVDNLAHRAANGHDLVQLRSLLCNAVPDLPARAELNTRKESIDNG